MTAALHAVTETVAATDAAQAQAPAAELFPHAMIDIETMAQHTSRALILSIACVPFALEPSGPRFGEPVLMLPDLSYQLLAGRFVQHKTQGFWGKQPPAAYEHWLGKASTHRPAELLPVLTHWLEGNTTKRAELWARGQGFDFGNLDNIMDPEGGDSRSPWAFWNLRDQRTATTFFPKLRDRPTNMPIAAAPHDPVHDCMVQAWALWERAPAEAIGLPAEANPVRDAEPMAVFDPPVALGDCPPGLFRFNDTLGFRSEYGDDAYVVETGEAFWGGASDRAMRNALLVIPMTLRRPFAGGETP